ncbi:MAG: helix-turn-helix domain-containing protein [Chloroflexi bacterium]|nr:helix-turn-helix domain-containing protein [Chloroflexota bacterium]
MLGLNDAYMSSGEAARVLRMHPLAIQRLILRGQLPGEKIANRWLIPRAAVEELAKTYVPKRGGPRRKRKYTRRGGRHDTGSTV